MQSKRLRCASLLDGRPYKTFKQKNKLCGNNICFVCFQEKRSISCEPSNVDSLENKTFVQRRILFKKQMQDFYFMFVNESKQGGFISFKRKLNDLQKQNKSYDEKDRFWWRIQIRWIYTKARLLGKMGQLARQSPERKCSKENEQTLLKRNSFRFFS